MTTETPYALDTYMIKVTTNSSNQPLLQVVTRINPTVVSSFSISSLQTEIYTEDTDFYIVGSAETNEEYVNTVDPCNNDVYLSDSGEIQYINGSEIYLDTYNAFVVTGEGGVSFYQKEKEQACLRKAS